MKNLEQIRARNAFKLSETAMAGKKGGEVIKKIPPLIQNHGLLATAAYSLNESDGWQKVFDAIATHLADDEIKIIPKDKGDRTKMIDFLTSEKADSETLKRATAETMAWLVYARRFIRKN